MSTAPLLTAGELTQRLGGRLIGDAARRIGGVAPLNEAEPDDLSWVGVRAFADKLPASRAGIVLVSDGIDVGDVGERTIITVPDADAAIADALAWLAPERQRIPPGVHPSATVADDADVRGAAIGAHVYVGRGTSVGEGTQLHPGVYVGDEARIGRDCVLWPNGVVRERCRLGDRVIVHPNVTIGADGFGYLPRDGRHLKIPQIGIVVIEDDVEIGANSAIDRARSGVTRVGRGTKIDNLVQVAHNVTIGEDCIIVAQCGIAGSVKLGHHVVLAGQVGLSDHVRLGDGVLVTAKSGVYRDIPDGQTVGGLWAMEQHEYLKTQAALNRLPRLIEQVRALSRRVEELESSTDHKA